MGRRKWTHERFWELYNDLPDKDMYDVGELPENLSAHCKFTISCKRCNYSWSVTINSFFNQKSRCYICNRGKNWDTQRFLREIDALDDKNEYIFSNYDKISSMHSSFSVLCKKCNYVWIAHVGNFFYRNSRCNNCRRGEQWTNNRVMREFNLTADCGSYTLIITEIITNKYSKFTVKCKKGHIWQATVHTYFNMGVRCPRCCASHGERKIEVFLENNGILFEREKRFHDCKNVLPLAFDFFLIDYGICIEYNGMQHYEPISFSSDKNIERANENLLINQKRDAIKKQWAIDNGYRFLEIPYTDINNIEEILKKELRL